MVSFFKNFGKGVLYTLVLPGLLAGLVVYAVVALFVFIYLAIKGLILFFTGRSLYEDLPEDVEAKRILNGNKGVDLEEPTTKEEPIINNQENDIQATKSVDPFYVPEYLKEQRVEEEIKEEVPFEEPKQEAEVEQEVEEENDLFESLKQSQEDHSVTVDEEEEKIEETPIFTSKSSQNSNILDINELDDIDDSDDDNTGSGINIDYD